MENDKRNDGLGTRADNEDQAVSSSGDMPHASELFIDQEGGFVCKLSFAYGNNFSGETDNEPIGEGILMELSSPPVNVGDICYPIANILGGLSSYQSSNGFIYDPNGGVVKYKISGTTLNPSWSGP